MRRLWIALAAASLAMPAAAALAQDWGNFAIISSTLGVKANRLCIGEGLRVSDIGCPSYAPSVTTAGDVSVTGNLSANKFIGDGSELTGITADATDRITSGTTRMVVVSSTGYVSLTQAGINTGWFNPYTGLVTLGVSTTGAISGTSGYFADMVGIGTTSPVQELDVAGDINLSGATSRTISFGNTGVAAPGAGSNGLKLQLFSSAGAPGVMGSNDYAVGIENNNMWFNNGSVSGGFKWYVQSSPKMALLNDKLGIGTIAPSATLHVQHYNSYTTPDAASYPLILRNTAWAGNQITGLEFWNGANKVVPTSRILSQMAGSGGAGDRLIFQTQSPNATNPNPDNPTTKMVIANSGEVGIGSNLTPLAMLDVAGTISASDAIQVGTSSLGCGAGIPGAIRYNTGNIQYCNGSAWTSLSSGTTAGPDGSGAANHIAYWSDADTLTYDSSQLYWNASTNRLGIGTNNPSMPLFVGGTGQIGVSGSTAGLYLYDRSIGTGYTVLLRTGNATNLYDNVAGATHFTFNHDTVSLGINTATPQAKLTIGGTAGQYGGIYLATATSRTLAFGNVGTAAPGAASAGMKIQLWGNTPGTMAAGDYAIGVAGSNFWFNNNNNAVYSWYTNSVLNMQLLANGNLNVVGTVSASDAVQVGTSSLTCNSNIPGAIRYNAGSVQYCNGSSWTSLSSNTMAGVSGSGAANHIAYWSDADTLTYDSNQLYWDASANELGIGTNAPAAKLEVYGGAIQATNTNWSNGFRNDTYSGTQYNGYHIRQASGTIAVPAAVGSNAYLGEFRWYGHDGTSFGSGSNYAAQIAARAEADFTTSARPTSMIFYTNQTTAAAERMRITSAGNIGVGNASPGAKLAIGGAAGSDGGIYIATNTSRTLSFGNAGVAAPAAGSVGMKVQLYGSNPGILATNDYALGVETNNMWFNTGTTSGGYKWYVPGNARMALLNDSLGIGTTTPKAMLDVAGTISASNAIQVGTSSLACGAGIPGAIRYSTGSIQYCNGSAWTSLSSNTTAGVSGSGAANHVAYWSAADTLAYDSNQLYWNASTNRLGIGTASPAAPLTVVGDISTTGELVSTGANNLRAIGGTYGLLLRNDGTTSHFMLTNAGDPYGTFNSLRPLSINNATGRVKVGASAASAGAPLGVAGDVSISGNYYAGNGAVGTPAYNFAGDTNTGMYWVAADQLRFSAGGAQRGRFTTAGLIVTGYVSTTGIVDIGTQALGNAGDSAGTPTYSWSGDTNTGLFTPGADIAAISAGGTERLRVSAGGVSSSANFFAPNGAVGTPSYSFAGDTNTGMYWVSADALGFSAGGTQRGRFTTAGLIVTGYVSTSGAVDIGTQALGNAGDSASIPTYSWSGDTNTGLFTPGTDIAAISAGGTERLRVSAGGISSSVNFYAPNGSASNPSFNFASDPDNGMYHAATNEIAFSTAGTESMRIDASGNVAIGNSTPLGRLDVRNTGSIGIYSSSDAGGAALYANNTSTGYGVYSYSTGNYSIYAKGPNSGTNYGAIIGIDKNTTYYGILGANNGYGIYCYGSTCGGNVAWTPASDARLKEKVTTLDDAQGLDLIARLRPVTFHWKDNLIDRVRGLQYGFIAQEVEKVIPEVVVQGSDLTVHHADGTTEDVKNTKAMDYGAVVVPLVKAVQQLKAQNEALEQASDNAAAKNATLQQAIEELNAANIRLKAANENMQTDIDALKKAVYRNDPVQVDGGGRI
jgi:hypothetical protein